MAPDHIVGARKTEGGFVCPGSVLMDCVECGSKLWISRSGQAKVKRGKLLPICLDCVLAKSDEKLKFTFPTRQELLSDLTSEN
jgi:hypothetical protein